MRKEDVQKELAKNLKQMRINLGLSKAKIADKVYLDERTWAKYEEGISAPSAPELVRIYDALGVDILKTLLNSVYPETYTGIEDADSMRQAAVHFIQHVASDSMIRDLNYIIFGGHGSNLKPQLAEFVVLNHLPMDYRVAIAKNAITFYRLAEVRGELVCPEAAPPDFTTLVDAIRQGLEAAGDHRNSYTTAIRKEAHGKDNM